MSGDWYNFKIRRSNQFLSIEEAERLVFSQYDIFR